MFTSISARWINSAGLGLQPLYQEVFENGPASENHRLKRELAKFAQMWDRNLQEQGFITAAAQQQTHSPEAKA